MRFEDESKIGEGICMCSSTLVLPCNTSWHLWRRGRVLASHAKGRGLDPRGQN